MVETHMLPGTDTKAAEPARLMYGRGPTVVYACRMDPRFSDCLSIPPSCDAAPAKHTLMSAP